MPHYIACKTLECTINQVTNVLSIHIKMATQILAWKAIELAHHRAWHREVSSIDRRQRYRTIAPVMQGLDQLLRGRDRIIESCRTR